MHRSTYWALGRGIAAVAVIALVLSTCGGGDDDTGGSGSPPTSAKPTALAATQSGQPFAEPPRVASVEGVLHFDLVASDRGITVGGTPVQGRAYDDGLVGPTLVVDPGDTIALTLDNQLDAHTNIHFHGLHVSPQGNSDDIFLSVEPGEKFAYSVKLPENHPPGTFWYHSHAHGISEQQVFGGLSGMLIVQGLTNLLPPDLRDIKDVAIGLKDAQVVGADIEATNIDSNAPTLRAVNSLHLPVQKIAPGEVQLWRLANIGADIWYDAQLADQQFTVIAEDGNPVWEVWQADDLVLPPGKRFDVLVTGPKAGSYTLKTLKYNQQGDVYPEQDLMEVVSAGDSIAPRAMPASLVPDASIPDTDIAARRTIVFTEDDSSNQFFIDGKQFDPDRVDIQVNLDTTEEWTLRNSTSEQHPFHIHVNDFQVISIDGKAYDAHSLQDTVKMPPKQDVVVRMRFTDFTGKFVFHCHILNHEDNGMMAVIEVVP